MRSVLHTGRLNTTTTTANTTTTSATILGLRVSSSPLRISQSFLPTAATSRNLSTSLVQNKGEFYKITYDVGSSGEKMTVEAKEGDNLLDIIINNDLDVDGFGACEGTLACSTCHVIFTPEDFAKLEDEATDEELDMLDLAFGLTDTSRLGCQVCMTKDLDGITVKVPEGVNDQR